MQVPNRRTTSNKVCSKTHVPRLRREAAAIVMLRRKNYSINTIAGLLGRSTSLVHKVLKANNLTGYSWVGAGYFLGKSLHRLDKRKSKGSLRDHTRPWAHLTLEIWAKWEAFVLGELDEPP